MTEPLVNDKETESRGERATTDVATSMAGLLIDKVDPSQPPPDGTCHFFRLPRELRDLVYEYSLSEPFGLYWFPRPGDFVAKIKVFEDTVYFEGDMLADDNKPWWDWYADPGDNHFQLFSCFDDTQKKEGMEANQLKYVCRQLHEETSGLGLKFNNLHFENSDISVPITQCFEEFIKSCVPKRLAEIGSVGLTDCYFYCEDEYWEKELEKELRGNRPDPRDVHPKIMFDFLAAYPQAQLCLTTGPSNESWKFGDLFHKGCYMRYAIDGSKMEHLLVLPSEFQEDIETVGLQLRRGATLEELNRPNFNLYPPRRMKFDEEKIRAELTTDQHRDFSLWVQNSVRGGVDGYVAELKRWFVKGIRSDPGTE
ncbi:hypothetical protein P171DRAFT_489585 [Karstenula rhodostoma CBS 690.94]|uniref:Uncharacterized protein n=1 Tax=Karstenula rhodostoma CBS 690.94 TaxID=1392251 RepID=A0A9P4PB42_9PLEO|nr:hypothetical protein P171DRAFT_489585 [Karstenula rhodostoma CBS 690.94]